MLSNKLCGSENAAETWGNTMKLTIIAAALAVAAPLAVASAAYADGPSSTLEIGYAREAYSPSGLPSLGFNTIVVRGGAQFSQHWGVEMDGGFGLGSDTIHPSGVAVTIKEDYQLHIYGVGYLPVSKDADIIGRVGYGRTHTTISGGGFSAPADDFGAAAGVGFRIFPGGGKNGFRVDYTHFFDNNLPGDTFGATYVRKF